MTDAAKRKQKSSTQKSHDSAACFLSQLPVFLCAFSELPSQCAAPLRRHGSTRKVTSTQQMRLPTAAAAATNSWWRMPGDMATEAPAAHLETMTTSDMKTASATPRKKHACSCGGHQRWRMARARGPTEAWFERS